MTLAEMLADLGDYGTGAAVVGIFTGALVPLQLLVWGAARVVEALR